MEINDDDMNVRVAGFTLAEAWRTDATTWAVSGQGMRYTGLDRDQAISALTIVECLSSGMSWT
ncbi:MAG: hypothetical protein ACREMY_13725, partial [bacterium]